MQNNHPSMKPTPPATILIVDDTPMNLRLAADLLGYEGYQVWRAESAREAFSIINNSLPDLLLLDIQMPETDGLAFARQLRALPACDLLPIIAVTSFAMKGDEEKARAAGCDGYITKPINTRTFCAQVAEGLRNGRQPWPTAPGALDLSKQTPITNR